MHTKIFLKGWKIKSINFLRMGKCEWIIGKVQGKKDDQPEKQNMQVACVQREADGHCRGRSSELPWGQDRPTGKVTKWKRPNWTLTAVQLTAHKIPVQKFPEEKQRPLDTHTQVWKQHPTFPNGSTGTSKSTDGARPREFWRTSGLHLESWAPPARRLEGGVRSMMMTLTQGLRKNLVFKVHFWKTISETISYVQKSREYKSTTTRSTCHFNHQLVHGPLWELLRPHGPLLGKSTHRHREGREAETRRILLQWEKCSSEDNSAAAPTGHGSDGKGAVTREPQTDGPWVALATWHNTRSFIKLL